MDPEEHKKKYHDYLLSPEWKQFRKDAFVHYGRKCTKCSKTKNLQIHHHHYRNIFHELMDDVTVLCKACHEAHHKIEKIPKKKAEKRIKKSKSKRRHEKSAYRSWKSKSKRPKVWKPVKTEFPVFDAILERKRIREENKVKHKVA